MDIRETSYLNEYNVETYNNITNIFKTENRCAVVQPTGTGKSYIMMKLLYDYIDTWKIVIAPSRDFLDSLERKKYWTNEKTLTLTYALIGINSENLDDILKTNGINKEDVGLIVIDEMHRAAAPKWGAGIKNLIKMCNNAKLLGLTATPKRYDKGVNMVEELFDNNIACNMGLYDAIEMGILPKLNYVVGIHDISININEIINRIPKDEQHQYIIEKVEHYKNKWNFVDYFTNTVSKYIDTNEKTGKHIVFASSIEEANRMHSVVKKWFKKLFKGCKINVYCIHSKNINASEELEEFFKDNNDNEIKVAVSVNMLNESFHCNDIKTISMFRGTQSIQVYMQQIGRALTANGETPFIFDFVDNFHSIEEIKEMLTSNKNVNNKEINFVMFSKFIDEAAWFGQDLYELKKLTDKNRLEHYIDIIDKLKESEDGTIYTLKDKKYIMWAEYLMQNMSFNLLSGQKENIKELINYKLGVNIDLACYLGYDWYNTWLSIINNEENIDKRNAKKIRSKFNKMLILNVFRDETLKFLKEHGLESSVTNNEEKLIYLLENNEPKKFKYAKRVKNFPCTIENEEYFLAYRNYRSISREMSDNPNKHFGYEYIGDACAYWIWRIYRERYKESIESMCKFYEDHSYIEEFILKSGKYYCYTGAELVNEVDNYFRDIKDLDNIDVRIKSMLIYYKIKDIDRINNIIFRELGITDAIKKVEDNIIHSLECNKSFEKAIKAGNTDIINISNRMIKSRYEWSNCVKNELDRLKNLVIALEHYSNNSIEDNEKWFVEYINNLQMNISLDKDKRNIISFNENPSKKLLNMIEHYDDISKFESEISKEFIEEFRENCKIALDTWISHYGNKPKYNIITGIIALSNSKVCNSKSNISLISSKLSDSINNIFHWLKYCDYYLNNKTDTVTDIALEIDRAFKIIGNNAIYLFNNAMSKKNKKLYMNLYNNYINKTKNNNKTYCSILANLTDRDTQLLYDVSNCRLINEYTNINEFNSIITNIY